MPEQRHFTTRRGFITALGFGAVSLYGAWAAFGAAPLPFSGHKETADPHAGDALGGHGGHGGHKVAAPEPEGHDASAMAPEEFRFEHDFFVQKYTREDGSVDPHASDEVHHGHTDYAHGGHDHGMAVASGTPVDVYLMAQKFAYTPDRVRLKAGVPYRFRMMAEDITHGASIQLGAASRIIRLRPNVVTEQTLTFTKPGEYLVYCTVYCGMAHDAMQGRIVVA
jgi:heme/copper-type cytochrome/quinol oxidase subunit 2